MREFDGFQTENGFYRDFDSINVTHNDLFRKTKRNYLFIHGNCQQKEGL